MHLRFNDLDINSAQYLVFLSKKHKNEIITRFTKNELTV